MASDTLMSLREEAEALMSLREEAKALISDCATMRGR
jgi:hypothetical protein